MRLLIGLFSLGSFATMVAAPMPGGQAGPGGREAVVDLPTELRTKNIGGSDGAGLCVYTSVQHQACWQDEKPLRQLQAWAAKRPGGSYPQKLAADLAAVSPETAAETIQHTGGDMAFLDAAILSGRAPGITYCGRDPFYGPNATIAHMVNLVHLDGETAAILDNNHPKELMWMSREDFRQRWVGNRGGWAVVLPRPAPPPVPRN